MIINSAKVEDHCLRTVVLPMDSGSPNWACIRILPGVLVKTQTSASYPQSFRFYMPGVSVCFQVMITGNSYLILWDGFAFPPGHRSFLLHIHCWVPCWELRTDFGHQSKLSVCAALPLSLSSHFCLPRLSALSQLRESTGFCLHPLPVLPPGKHLQTVCWGNPRAAFVCCLISQGSLFHCLMLNVFKTIVLSFIYFK